MGMHNIFYFPVEYMTERNPQLFTNSFSFFGHFQGEYVYITSYPVEHIMYTRNGDKIVTMLVKSYKFKFEDAK